MWPFSSSYASFTPKDVDGQEFDYIIVGAGTAGCVLASRLSEDPSNKVLLVERGPIVSSWASHIPLLSADYSVKGAPVYIGKAMGGTSKVNISVYHRSVPGEYNAWAAAGREGWGWSDVKPFFLKSENSMSHPASSDRGHSGPWVNQRMDPIVWDFVKHSVTACKTLGIPSVDTVNEPSAPAVACSRTEVTVDDQGRRRSTFDSFLPVNLVNARKNLFLCPETVVTSITFEQNGAVLRASGIVIEEESTLIPYPPRRVTAKREVILCAGAIGTPQILLLSGVGPTRELQEVGAKVVLDLPHVGKGLQDHFGVPLIYKAPRKDSLYELQQSPLLMMVELIKYLFTRRGLFLLHMTQVTIMARSALLDASSVTHGTDAERNGDDPSNLPDIEIMPTPFGSENRPETQAKAKNGAVTLLCVLLRPKSSGEVTLKNLDPRGRPSCDFKALRHPDDLVVMRKALRLGLTIADQVRTDGYPLGEPIVSSGPSDAELDAHIRDHAIATFHFSSTCRMAPIAEGGVVDDRLRVHGISNLRIADASVFPTIPASHLQAPASMLGERCAAFVKADAKHH